MGKASSAKKVARVAKSGKGGKVRSGQGQVFYLSIALVALLGLALIVFARQSGRETRVASPPTLSDHWHQAYGVYVCGQGFLPPVTVQDDPLGIHTHADGLIHIHPFSSEATGANAKLGVFFDSTGIRMSDSKLELPNDGGTWDTGYTCPDGQEVNSLRVAYWADPASTGAPTVFTSDFDNIRFTADGGVYVIAVVPDDFDFTGLNTQLPSVGQLANPVDLTNPSVTSVPGGTTIPGETTVPGATPVPGATTVPGASVPAGEPTTAPAVATTTG